VWEKRSNFCPEHTLPIKPLMHICPCSWAIEMSKKTWIQAFLGPVTFDSEEGFHHFTFWRHGSRFASFFIVHEICIFWGASFKLMSLVTLVLEKLHGFCERLLYHCYTQGVEFLLKTDSGYPKDSRDTVFTLNTHPGKPWESPPL